MKQWIPGFGEREKKVEYIELIYDLIFVYLLGRNNALLHSISDGFFTANGYFLYILSTLVILQIWYFSSLFINRYGSNGVSDHIGLFVNMYLLYYLADGTRAQWLGYYTRYNVAWGLILVNLAVQYALRLRRGRCANPWESRHLRYHMILLLCQAGIVLLSIPLYNLTGIAFSWVSLLFGFVAGVLTERIDALVPVNFEHMTERVMLFVVFAFGEMIVSIAEYFEGDFSFNTVYFSLMAFLIVAGLFLSYGFLYNHIIDRERHTTGTGYMLIHIFLIIALDNITVALEFMREPQVGEVGKNIFLVASFLAYYLAMFCIGNYGKESYTGRKRFFAALLAGAAVLFVALMALCYRISWASIGVSVLFVYAVFAMIASRGREKGA
ncbi:MAG: low temperature requirement protein A [Oscillospiraceae bacterium]|nr:low temperature requirement protein A [Oscillospiraceae bacterium]